MPLTDRRLLAAGALFLLLLVAWLWWRPAAVDTVVVENRAIRETLQVTGRVATRDRIALAAQVPGTVGRVAVEEGAEVTAGQVLLVIDNPEIAAGARQAEAALRQAEARLARIREIDRPVARAEAERARIEFEQARRQVENLEPLRAAQTVGAEQFRTTQETRDLAAQRQATAALRAQGLEAGGRDWKLAEAELAQAAAARDVARARQDWLTVRAPAAGRIIARHVDPGAPVQTASALLDFAPEKDTEVRVDVDERFLDLLRTGQAVAVIADAWPDARAAGRVRHIAPRVDAARGSVELRIALEETPDWLREDLTVSVEILVSEKPAAPVLPVGAVLDQNSRPWAWCVQEQRLRRCELAVGLHDAQHVEVLAGAAAGTEVVAVADRTLKDGTRVRTRRLAR
ncbi:MAG: efflux RND transporter periplasmic adaptor subunit [Gammaproteobacteria bacterium]